MKIGIIIPTYEEHHNIKIFYAFKKIKNIQFFFVLSMEVYNKTSLEIKKYFKRNFKILYEKRK